VIDRSATGQPPTAARALVACASVSAKTGDAIAMTGWSMPAAGTPRVVLICNSTRSSSSGAIDSAQPNTSSATSAGYRYRDVPNTLGRLWIRTVNEVTTAKKPGPEPRAAQYRSASCSGSQ